VNLAGPHAPAVRALLIDNARHWILEYHADGLRLDATHALLDTGTPHFVAELTAAVRDASGGRALVYAEDHRNLASMIEDPWHGGWGLDGVWADDFHHVVRRMVAGDAHGYYQDYEGRAAEIARIIHDGWLFTGQHSTYAKRRRGTDPSGVPLRKSVVCIQNHDQIGNRARGDRLHHTVDAATWRAASVLLLTSPMTPLLFMGQEWAASTPFAFFTDFEPALAGAVVDGRRREFAAFPEFAGAGITRIPSPQADVTFEDSRLRWTETRDDGFARVLALHQRLLAMRRDHPSLQGSDACTCDADALGEDAVAFVRHGDRDDDRLVVARLRGSGPVSPRAWLTGPWTTELDTEDPAFACDPRPPSVEHATGTIVFQRPGALVFRRQRT
jgi:maltooligosyltrehalose trehalohydrolase